MFPGVVHLADIANCARPWNVYKHLVVQLEEEFFLQGDMERSLGMPITTMMDRSKDTLAGGQTFFLEKLVLPLLELYLPLIDEEMGTIFRGNLESNKKHWQDLIEKHG